MSNDTTETEPVNVGIGTSDLFGELEYIAASPAKEHGGFHPRVVAAAAGAIAEIQRLRELAREMLDMIEEYHECNWDEEPFTPDIDELELRISGPNNRDVPTPVSNQKSK